VYAFRLVCMPFALCVCLSACVYAFRLVCMPFGVVRSPPIHKGKQARLLVPLTRGANVSPTLQFEIEEGGR
jgi:hypothetical protein